MPGESPMGVVGHELIFRQNPYEGFDASKWPIDLQGWNSDLPTFKRLLAEVRPTLIVEVGTWKGASAIHLARICDELKLAETKIICVDTWLGALEFWTNHLPGIDRYAALNIVNGYPQVYYQFL